jgi:hypothetical protein
MARRWKPAKSIATAPVPLANRSRPAGSPQPELTGETV